MSATNRGAVRIESDFYRTPEKAIDPFLDIYNLNGGSILEPCAGDGAIIKAIRKHGWIDEYIIANEIRAEERGNLIRSGADLVVISDFLNGVVTDALTIISNPPYSIAQEIIEKCFEIAKPEAEIIMLLRLAFLESKKRREFWKKHPLTQLYSLIERPSFTGHGTDATAYGWFVWSNKRQPLIKSI